MVIFQFAGDPFGAGKDTYVALGELSGRGGSTRNSDGNVQSAEGSAEIGAVELPDSLKPYFESDQNRKVLYGHMDGLSSSERRKYLSNLADVVREAKRDGDDVVQVINQYFRVKATKLALEKADDAACSQRRLYAASACFGILMLISMVSLILVVLAVERNTRPVWSQALPEPLPEASADVIHPATYS